MSEQCARQRCRTNTQRVNDDTCRDCRRREAERALPFGFERAEQLLEPFCACGHVISKCNGSRAGCGRRREKDHALRIAAERRAEEAEGLLASHAPDGHNATNEQVVRLRDRITELGRERDAWRAATGLAHLTPAEAGAEIDRQDEEAEARIAELERERDEVERLRRENATLFVQRESARESRDALVSEHGFDRVRAEKAEAENERLVSENEQLRKTINMALSISGPNAHALGCRCEGRHREHLPSCKEVTDAFNATRERR